MLWWTAGQSSEGNINRATDSNIGSGKKKKKKRGKGNSRKWELHVCVPWKKEGRIGKRKKKKERSFYLSWFFYRSGNLIVIFI